MNKLEFSFEPAPWEQWLGSFPEGAKVPAGGLLTVLEGEEEQDEPGKEKRSIHEKISAYKKSTQLENTEERIGISSEICIG